MKKLTTGKIWQFAAGQFGWAMLSGIISNWLVYFYQPDKTAISQGQTVFIPQGLVVFGIFTIIGGITAFGRIFDAFTDPMIASLSDRCTSKNGRRIPFLKWASLPLALSTVLVFWSPVNKNSWINGVFLLVMILAYYLSITAYCTPHNALIPELGHTQQERLNISTVISFTFIAGTAVAYLAPTIWGMFIPAFRKFVASDIFYWIALTMFQTGLPFFVTSLLKLPETMTTLYFVGMTALSLVFYIPVNKLTPKLGKKKMILFAFAVFSLAYFYTGFMGKMSFIPASVQGLILTVVAALPMAIFGILPQAVVADISQSDSITSGSNREGMFYAARTFAFKLGQSISMLIFTAVSTIGAAEETGYRVAAFGAAVFCCIGGIILVFYNEKKINGIINRHQ